VVFVLLFLLFTDVPLLKVESVNEQEVRNEIHYIIYYIEYDVNIDIKCFFIFGEGNGIH
jgi:hypothetical protein